ncbi:MAG TPA: hypothetical protein VFB14_10710 [Bryobacteraceae bacterium]|jgi:hypothetical protein|nr:hypothetical protein [Bryobacteraceae bacterium]
MKVLDSESVGPNSALDPLDPRWQLVQRIAASRFFSKGPKLRAFFLYICENSLLGRQENLTSQLIGTRVFGREPDYIPSEDNIVRVEARELRKRLAAYFESEGRSEPFVIEIPKGSYSPIFVPRGAAISTSSPPPAPAKRTNFFILALSAALAIALAFILWSLENAFARGRQEAFLDSLHQPVSSKSNFSIYRDLLGPLGVHSERGALLVLSNPRVITYSVSRTGAPPGRSSISIPVPAAVKPALAPLLKESDRQAPFQFLDLNHEGYTGMGEAAAAFHIGRLMDLLGRRVQLTQGRFLNWDHIDRQDLILLGGPQSNDWSYEKDAKAVFSIVGGCIENARPLPGEQSRYCGDQLTDYALIEKLTTPYNFETLLLAGISNAGTAAAGEFLANPNTMDSVYRRIRTANAGKGFPADWEILLRVAVRDGLPLKTAVVTTRPYGKGTP